MENCILAIRNLSHAATEIVSYLLLSGIFQNLLVNVENLHKFQNVSLQTNIQGLSKSLVELLRHPNPQIVIYSAGIIGNLTAISSKNKLAVFSANGIEVNCTPI